MSTTSSAPAGDSGTTPLNSLTGILRGLRYWRSIVQLSAHDVSTEEGRTAERHRRVFWSAFASFFARASGLVLLLVAVPLTVHYLGQERYGLWMTISSIIAVMAFADLGLGSGLMTSLSHAQGKGDREAVRRQVSTAFFSLFALAIVVGGLLALVWPLIPWPRIYNVTSPAAAREAGPATAVFLACNLLLLPLSVAEDSRTGQQSSFSHSVWVAAGNGVGLAGLLVAVHFRAGLPWLVLAMSGGTVFGALLSFSFLFLFEQPDLRPSFERVGTPELRSLLRLGALFFVLELSVFLTQSSDNFVLTQLRGASAVTRYSVVARLFGIISGALAFLTTPLWPAYGEALSRGDLAWVRRTLPRSTAFVGVTSALGAGVLVVGGKWIVDRWVGPEVEPSLALLAGLGIWTVLQCVGHAYGMFLNGAGVIRFQIIFASISGVACVLARIALTLKWGIPGVAWGTVLAFLPLSLLPAMLFSRKFLRSGGGH